MRQAILIFAGVLGMSAAVAGTAADGGDYARQTEDWRAQRLARLTAPDGWLSLIGLHWLKPGRNTIGTAQDNDVVLARGPAHLGVVTLDGERIELVLTSPFGARIDGEEKERAELRDDRSDKPTRVTFGTVSFIVIDRSGRKALRVKDSEAETRTHFLGIDSFAINPGWRIEARWVPFDPPHELEVSTVIGTVEKYPVPGKAVFERDGHTFELLPVIEVAGDKELFLIFTDRTAGKETYGAARFLYAPMPTDGRLVLDFNRAYNPPCAFTPYATCPLAPPENRLDLRVTAGEKKYRGGTH